MGMLSSLASLLFTVILQPEQLYLLQLLFKLLYRLSFGILKFFVLIAKLVGGFFYLLLLSLFDFPVWLISFITSASPNAHQREGRHCRRVRKQINMSEGWVRISICNTDYISSLDLAKGHEGWERRVTHKVTKEEIQRRVLPWLEDLLGTELDHSHPLEDHDIGTGLCNPETTLSERHVMMDTEPDLELRRPASAFG
jgi:hypothetical protein